MKYVERFLSPEPSTMPRWQSYLIDSILAIAGVVLITIVIAVAHLYPRIPTISFVYLLLVLALASTRGLFAAILTSLLAFLAFDYFFFPPPYTFVFVKTEDLFTVVVFLATAIIAGQMALTLRQRAEQARSRERELRRLYEQAQQLAALQERQRLARELHDSVSQALYGISLGIHTAQEVMESDPEQARASLEYVIALAEAGLTEMRALIFELRPESMATEGLLAALNKQVAVLRARYKLNVEADLVDEPDLPVEMKEALYRVAQEALHNIVRHARASTVILRLASQQKEVNLEVRDNGRGFDPASSFPGHLGLRSMQERIAKAGGSLSIESDQGQGTRICARIPLPPKTAIQDTTPS
jgi:signal transduction histidine kinase